MKKYYTLTVLAFILTHLHAQHWNNLGITGFSQYSIQNIRLAVNSTGTPYVTYRDSVTQKVVVKKHNGSTWVNVGASGFSSTISFSPSIAIDPNGIVYVAYTDASFKITVMMYDGSSWQTVGAASFTPIYSGYPSIAIDYNGIPTVSFSDFVSNKVYVMSFDGNSWVNVGVTAFTAQGNTVPSLVVNSTGVRYVGYCLNNHPMVKKYTGSSWVNVDSAGLSSYTLYGSANLAIDNTDTLFIGLITTVGTGYALKFNGTAWTSGGFATGGANTATAAIALNSNRIPYIAYFNGGFGASVKKCEAGIWKTVGTDYFANSNSDPALAITPGNMPLVAFADGNKYNKATVMKYDCTPATSSVSITRSGPSDTICANAFFPPYFTAVPVYGGENPFYRWFINGIQRDSATSIFSPATGGLANGDVITCQMTSSDTCVTPHITTSNSITMTVLPAVTPTVSIAANPNTEVCTGTAITFTPTLSNAGSSPTLYWYVNNNYAASGSTFSSNTLVNGNIVSCTLASSLACATAAISNYDTVRVFDTIVPHIVISANPPGAICAGVNVTYTAVATGGGSAPVYQWKKNGNNVGTNSASYSSASLANGDVITCQLSSNFSCAVPAAVTSNALTTVVTATVAPSVSISANPAGAICAGTSVTFTATPVNGGTSPAYQWKLNGNNVGSNSATYTNTSLANGNIITCVLTSNLGCASPTTATSGNITMTVNPLVTPAVSVSANPSGPVCQGTSVTFTASPTNGGAAPAYQWKLNGNNIGGNSATYTSNTLGNGNVITCVLTSNALCASPLTATSAGITMSVNAPVTPSVTITANPSGAVCSGANVTFTANPTNGGGTPAYQWKVNGNNVGGNSQTYSSNSLANGAVVTCVLTSNALCASPTTATSGNMTMAITPSVTPSVSISASPPGAICAGATVTFTANPTNGGGTPAYQWKVNGSNVGSNSQTYSNSSLANGNVVSCVLTSNALCASPVTATSGDITMTVNPVVTPAVSVSATPGNSVCTGANVAFTALPTNGGTTPAYQWKLNGNNVGNNSTGYNTDTLHNGDVITCVLTSNANCATVSTTTSNAVTMAVGDSVVPDITITASPGTAICAGTAVTFTALPVNGGTAPVYQWKLNGSNAGTNSAAFTSTTLADGDSVTCVLTSNAVCVHPTTVSANTMAVTVHTLPTAAVTPTGSMGLCTGDTATLTSSVATHYQWRNNATPLAGDTAVTLRVSTVGNYSVIITDANGCKDTSGYTSVVVSTLPTVTLSGNADTLCLGAPAVTLTGGSPAGGVFSGTGVSGSQFTANTIGINRVTYTYTDANNCSNHATEEILVTVCTGINQLTQGWVRIYPNPASGFIYVTLEGIEQATLTLFDITGKMLLTQKQNTGTETLNLSTLSAGVYSLQITNANGGYLTTQRIIKQ